MLATKKMKRRRPVTRQTHDCRRRLVGRLERLECRLPLAGNVTGLVFNDANENGTRDAGEDLLQELVYLDVNENGVLDVGEPSAQSQASIDPGGWNYSISNSLPNGTQVPVRIDAEVSRIATPGFRSNDWIGMQSLMDDTSVDEELDGNERTFLDTKAQDIVYGDLNGDGRTDLVVLQLLRDNDNPASVGVYLANSDGSFPSDGIDVPVGGTQNPQDVGPNANAPTRFVSHDLNNNGQDDLIIVDAAVGQVILLGDFDGNDFSERHAFESIGGAFDLVVENFDSDAEAEIVILARSGSNAYVYDSSDDFQYSLLETEATGRINPGRIVADDFNNDQQLDLAIFHALTLGAPSDSQDISVLLGAGDGTFSDPLISTIEGRSFASFMVSGFFAGEDQNVDLAVISGSEIVILQGDGSGGLTEFGSIDESEDNGTPNRLSAFDVDGDGDKTTLPFVSSGNDARTSGFGNNNQFARQWAKRGGNNV